MTWCMFWFERVNGILFYFLQHRIFVILDIANEMFVVTRIEIVSLPMKRCEKINMAKAMI